MQLLTGNGFVNVKELHGGYYEWRKAHVVPGTDVTDSTPVFQPYLGFDVGDPVIDFWLKDLSGAEYSLMELLAEKPVLLIFGSYTSLEFRENLPGSEALVSRYGNQIEFVIVYVIEPHPVDSQSPYSDKEWLSSYSYNPLGNPVQQPQTYDARLKLANMCAQDSEIKMLILIDEMTNPVWQVYGTAPNLAYLIGIDGVIAEAQLWYDTDTMKIAIEQYLAK